MEKAKPENTATVCEINTPDLAHMQSSPGRELPEVAG